MILLSLPLLAGRMQSGKIDVYDFLAFLRVSNHLSAYPVTHNLGYWPNIHVGYVGSVSLSLSELLPGIFHP